ncbi:MAG: hypothetical protein LC768_06785 [Acidobacteria bacterium]|nr:hypothetical protein [Acidobacteriota bacterium]MCA1638029.1 hypothetical protein [Acidobacteriota bacterium]
MARPKLTANRHIKRALLEAFDKSETKTVLSICRAVKIQPTTYYYHFNKDADFKRQIIEKRREHLAGQIAA